MTEDTQITIEDFARADLRVGTIRSAEPHPKADRLLVLTVDLGEMRGFNYHTGVTFEGFVDCCAEPVCSGGRYDSLLERYGMPAPATGFAFNILSLLAARDTTDHPHATPGRDILLFNGNQDRTTVISLARRLRDEGYSVARDIITRDLDQSVRYARMLDIRAVVVTSDDADPPLTIIDSRTGETQQVREDRLSDALSTILERTRRRDNG
jgi:ATP phosphoribosyltransferase regulatory subunit